MTKSAVRITLWTIALAGMWSCTVVRNFRPDQPFIYENVVKVNGISDKEKRSEAKTRLFEQIEDSVQVVQVSKLPWPKFPWFIPLPLMESPRRYDSVAVRQSTRNMRNLMSSLGYRGAEVKADSSLRTVKDQQRVKVTYEVNAGRLFLLDSLAYNLSDSNLQRLAMDILPASALKKGTPFEYALIDRELTRLVAHFNNHGYQRFTREDIIAEADTSYTELIDPSLDPFEYIQALATARARSQEPRVDVYVRLNAIRDSTHLKPYRVGSFTAYSDADAETAGSISDTTGVVRDGIRVIDRTGTFDPGFIARHIDLTPGTTYTLDRYSQTLNNFNRLQAWQNINLQGVSNDSTGTIDYLLKLTPERRQFFGMDLEGTSLVNNSQVVQVASGRIGMALNFTLRNRNLWKRAIQLENNLRTGVEFNDFKKFLSGEVTLTNRLTIPWMSTPFSTTFEKRFRNARTITSADFSYIDRFKYFQLRSFNTFLGYEWKTGTATSWQFKPFNFEYTLFRPDSLFFETIKDFPLLLYTYNNGLIIGANLAVNHNFNPYGRRHVNLLRVNLEESGTLVGSIFRGQTSSGKGLSTLYRYLKIDADYRHIMQFRQSSLHMRFFGGYGHAFPTLSRQGQVTLPFFKSYVAGGPNSMRGWQIRKLGVGSNISFDTTLDGRLNDKYADVQLEANLEYRFRMFQFFGFWMRGAVFTDIGNIWFRNDLSGQLPRAGFNPSRIIKDIAIASGFGMRADFSYFLLRFDLGFPLKDPRYGPHNTGNAKAESFYSPREDGWFVPGVWRKPVFQFAIGYPF
jgi:outer membrane protein insertion porin family